MKSLLGAYQLYNLQEFVYVKDDLKLNDSYEVIKYLLFVLIYCYRQLCSESPLYGSLDEEKKAIVNQVSSVCFQLTIQWIDVCKDKLEVPITILTMLATEKMSHEECPVLV